MRNNRSLKIDYLFSIVESLFSHYLSLIWILATILYFTTNPGYAQTFNVTTLTSPNPEAHGIFGHKVSNAGDVNMDGKADIIVGAEDEDGGATNAGRAYVFSGAGGSLLYTLTSPNPKVDGHFGYSVSGVGDVNMDGYADVIIGAVSEDGGAYRAGRAYVFSGATGNLLYTLTSPNPQANAFLGFSVSGVGDVNMDGKTDIVVGTRFESGGAYRAGRVYVYSGATGIPLHTLVSNNPEIDGSFGWSVSGAGDVDMDGKSDVIVGAVSEDGGAQDAGCVYVFSGANGSLLHTLTSPNPETFGRFGHSVSSADLDMDGKADVIVGAYREDDAGRVYVFSGADGSLLYTLLSPNRKSGGHFGFSVSGGGDFNMDGKSDVIVGANWEDGGPSFAGRAYVFSGADGNLLHTLLSPNSEPSGMFGEWVSSADVNMDGKADIIVGASYEDGGALNAGRAYIFETISTSTLVAYYPFNGNANDESGNANHGTVIGASLTTDRFGYGSSAYSFDGVDDYVRIPDSESLDITGDLSISAWVNTLDNTHIIFSNMLEVSPHDGYSLRMWDGKVRFMSGNQNLFGNTPINTGTWKHVVVTLSGTTATSYIDGVFDISTTVGVPTDNTVDQTIGASYTPYYFLHGFIDDIRIYNRALTEAEVQALYGGYTSITSFIFLAKKDVKISRQTVSDGDIHANDDIEFSPGAPSTHYGNLTAVDEIKILKNNTIEGDATAGDKVELAGNAVVTGTITHNATVEPIELPELSFTADGDDIKVSTNGSYVLAPGSYGKIAVNKSGSLYVSSGEYFLEELKMDQSSCLYVDITNGPVTVNVTHKLQFKHNVEMTMTPTENSIQVTFNKMGSDTVNIGKYSRTLGTLIAPDAKVKIKEGAYFKGSICAREVKVLQNTTCLHHSFMLPLPKIPAIAEEEEIEISTLPSDYVLRQNYPNPFNPTTTIQFGLPEAALVTMRIYNIRGQLVRTLTSGYIEAGYHQVQWDATNNKGEGVSSGFYFYYLQSGNFYQLKRMLLIK